MISTLVIDCWQITGHSKVIVDNTRIARFRRWESRRAFPNDSPSVTSFATWSPGRADQITDDGSSIWATALAPRY